MTITTIVKKIRERIYQLQKAYKELCNSGLQNESIETKKCGITTEINKLQTMLMEIDDIW